MVEIVELDDIVIVGIVVFEIDELVEVSIEITAENDC